MDASQQSSPAPRDLRIATAFWPASMPESAKLEILREIVRQAENFIDDQLRIALAADQRAVYVATAFAAFGAVLLAAALAALSSDQPCSGPYFWGLTFTTVLVCFAVAFALWSIRPQTFYTRGIPPRSWTTDLGSKPDLLEHLIDIVDESQKHIDANENLLSANGRIFMKAIGCGFAAPLLGGVVFAMAAYVGGDQCYPSAKIAPTSYLLTQAHTAN